MTRARAAWLASSLFAACAAAPKDPFVTAERSLARHDLAAALQALDAVPVAHARYPEARAAAVDVERDMRRCHELMLQAMLLRSEWRDSDAIATLQKVRTIWPGMPGVDVLIAATEQRRHLFAAPPPAAAGAPVPPPATAAAVEVAPVETTMPSAVALPVAPAAPAVEVAASPSPVPSPALADVDATANAPAAPVESAPALGPVAPPVVRPSPADDPVALGLVAVETRLARGQLEAAVVDLLELARRCPNDNRVRLRLVRLLHQRALLRYGDGSIAMAVADWKRVLELDPEHAAARRMLEAIEHEQR